MFLNIKPAESAILRSCLPSECAVRHQGQPGVSEGVTDIYVADLSAAIFFLTILDSCITSIPSNGIECEVLVMGLGMEKRL